MPTAGENSQPLPYPSRPKHRDETKGETKAQRQSGELLSEEVY